MLVEHDRFASLQQGDLVVTVGATTALGQVLRPFGVTESVNVTAERVDIDPTKTDQTTLIERDGLQRERDRLREEIARRSTDAGLLSSLAPSYS